MKINLKFAIPKAGKVTVSEPFLLSHLIDYLIAKRNYIVPKYT